MIVTRDEGVRQQRTRSNPTPIFIGQRIVGHVAGHFFHKRIAGSRHTLRRPPAIAFDISTLRDAQAAGASEVCVTDSESGAVYRAAIADVLAHGFAVVRGHGRQIALALERWSINGQQPQAERQAAAEAARAEAQSYQQIGLFSEVHP
jgi:hypothetical protein